jgi:hypothetical protein
MDEAIDTMDAYDYEAIAAILWALAISAAVGVVVGVIFNPIAGVLVGLVLFGFKLNE